MVVLAFAESVQILPDFALVVHVLLILLMIWVLNRTFFRPINRVISARQKVHGGRFTETEKMLESASEKEKQFTDELLAARNEGYELIEGEREKAVAVRQEKVSAAKAEIAAQKESELKELSKVTESARKEISKEAEKLAEEISANLIRTV